jgi:hypothetical protein
MISLLYSQQLIYKTEKLKKPQALLKIKLPFVSARFERTLNDTKFQNAIKTNDKVALQNYTLWAMKQNMVTPQSGYYFNLIVAQLFLGNKVKAQELLKKLFICTLIIIGTP